MNTVEMLLIALFCIVVVGPALQSVTIGLIVIYDDWKHNG